MTAPKSISLSPELRAEYEKLFSSCEVRKNQQAAVDATARVIQAQADRYRAVSAATGVPSHVIGVLHALQSGGSFEHHLHNGDPLSRKTVHAPKNRPPGAPPFTWEASALDALQLAGFTGWGDWSVAGTLFLFERHGGFRYRLFHPRVRSPYLWASTNHYDRGSYGPDGKFDARLVAQHPGAAAILRALGVPKGAGRAPRATRPRDITPSVYPGRVIRRGEWNHALVLDIQRRLVAVGCGPLDVDGDFGPGTEASVKLFQSRSVDSGGAPLTADGAIGPMTWEALFGRTSVPAVGTEEQEDPLLRKVIEIAASQVGVMEDPPHSNSGKEVKAYLASVAIRTPAPWCAAFVHWCFARAAEQLGIDNPAVPTGHCLTHWQQAPGAGARRVTAQRATDDPSLVMPGHVFILDHGEGKGHTGIVESVLGGMLVTVEGNTGPDGTREGLGVFRRKQRKISSINVGFIDYAPAVHLPPVVVPGPETPPAPSEPPTLPVPTSGGLADIAPLVLSARSGGLLLKAVQQGAYEEPTWMDVDFQGLVVRVGAHALRACVGGRLLRLPVSYKDAIAICNALGWVPPNYELSDAIWKAATVRVPARTSGDFDRRATQAIRDKKLTTLEYVVAHNDAVDGLIPKARWGELCATEGKDWVASKRNLTFAGAATTYGWHQLDGKPIQGRGPDAKRPAHDEAHSDYSQVLRPIQRIARRKSDGAEVDLVEYFREKGLPEAVLAPLRRRAMPPQAQAKARRARGGRNLRSKA